MKRHHLYEVDLKQLRAFCTVCGYTDIVLQKSRSNAAPKPICIVRAQEMREKQSQKLELAREERLASPDYKPFHTLSKVDPEKMTAICAVCGPTTIWKDSHTYKGKTLYICGTKNREYFRKYKQEHQVRHSTKLHSLSHVDEDAGTAVCSRCGPVKIEMRLVNKYVTKRCPNAKTTARSRKKKTAD